MKVCLGSPSAVREHWIGRMRSLTPAQRQASVLIVPDPHFGRLLAHRIPSLPHIVVLDEWLKQILPQHIMPAPTGTWEFLSGLVPHSLVPPGDRATPGFLWGLASTVRVGRALGMRRVPETSDRIPWSLLFRWYDSRFQGALADQLRLYEYAASTQTVPLPFHQGTIFIYGFSRFTKPFAQLLQRWDHGNALEIWAFSGLDGMGQTDLGEWNGLYQSLSSSHLEVGRHVHVLPTAGTDALDRASALIARGRDQLNAGVLLETAVASRRVWVRALVRQGLADEALLLHDRGLSLWRLFLDVASGAAGGPIIRRWLEEASPMGGADWARDWWERVQRVVRWGQLRPLLEEAASRNHQPWLFLLRWASRVSFWDEFGAPHREAVAQALKSASEEGELALDTTPVLPPSLAAWLPQSRLILAEGTGFMAESAPFARDEAIRGWIGQSRQGLWESRILKMWLNDEQSSAWIVARALPPEAGGLAWESDENEADVGVRPDSSGDERVRNWYRHWREDPRHSPFTGLIDGSLARDLMPGRLSPSALEDFGRCPLSFLRGRLLRIHTSDSDALQILPQTIGQWAHRSLELMVAQKYALSLENVRRCVRHAMAESPLIEAIPPFFLRYQEDRLTSELHEALLRDGWAPGLRAEVEVELAWEWIWPMRGRVDRIDFLRDGSIRLIDYKNGEPPNPAKPSPANLQLLLYHQAVAQQYQKPTAVEMFGVSQKSQFRHRGLTHEEAEAQWARLREIGEGVQSRMGQGQFFPVPDPRLNPCRFCAYRLVCPSAVMDYAEHKNQDYPEFIRLWEAADDTQG